MPPFGIFCITLQIRECLGPALTILLLSIIHRALNFTTKGRACKCKSREIELIVGI